MTLGALPIVISTLLNVWTRELIYISTYLHIYIVEEGLDGHGLL